MKEMKNEIICFLESFFMLFKAHIEQYKIIENKITGTVGWTGEEDKQDFIWNYEINFNLLSKASILCYYLSNNNLIEGDSVKISENELTSRLIHDGWSIDDVKNTIEVLFSIEIRMMDNGEESDSFFLHF